MQNELVRKTGTTKQLIVRGVFYFMHSVYRKDNTINMNEILQGQEHETSALSF